MKLFTRILSLTALVPLFCPPAAIAQTEFAPMLTPRIGGQLTTGPGAGYGSSFGSIYGWIPFLQTPGSNVGFAETRLNIATESGRLGGNFLLGYRGAMEGSDWVWGTYLGYDIRSNGRHTFHQLGTGADVQGGGWEARFNAYFPVGNTEATVAESDTVLSSTASDARFVGNYFQFTRSQTVRRDRVADSALTGADLEVGGKLAAWEGGDLRGYLGGYLYSGENVSTFAGFRSRIVARPTANTNIGLTVQRDREFGTNLILSFGANWGGSSPNPPDTPTSIAARLGEAIERQSNIALARRSSSSIINSIAATNALNPATGQPWFFRHVSANSNGNGTIETPYSSIEAALNGIPTDGNQIVYVQGSSSFGGNLTIANNVQLLSTGPIQQIPTLGGNLILPLSGSGNFPTLTAPVRLGSNSLIDGFNLNRALTLDNLNGTAIARNLNINITAPNDSGISCSNISGAATLNLSNVNLTVNNPSSSGIRCTNVSGTVTIDSAKIAVNNSQAAIVLQNNPGSVNLSGITATANNSAVLQGSVIGNLAIDNSTLIGNNAPGNGITLDRVSGTATIAANPGSRINGSVNHGLALTNSTGTINVSGLAMNNNQQTQLFLQNNPGTINLSDSILTANNAALIQGSILGNLSITNSTIIGDNAPGNGITLDRVSGTATLAVNPGSRVNGSVDNGIELTNSSGTINVSSLEIANNQKAQLFIKDNPGTANLTNSTLRANNAALVIGQTLGNLKIASSFLLGNNAPENAIALDRVSGTATIATNSGSRIIDAATNGIALTNSTGIFNIADFEIAGALQNAIRAQEVSGTLDLKNLKISNSGDRAFFLENTTGTLDLKIANSPMSNSRLDGVRVDLSGNANLTATLTGNKIEGVTDSTGDGMDFEAIGSSRMNLSLTGNTIQDAGNSAIELEVQGNGILEGNIANNTLSNSGGDGILFLHRSTQNSTLTAKNNTVTNSGTAQNGISRTPGGIPPAGITVGNGGFGIGVITLSNGNLQLIVENNTIQNSQDAKIGIASNPATFSQDFAGTSRVDARIQGNTLSGTGTGLGTAVTSGSFGALADNGSTVCLQLENNTANNIGLPVPTGYVLWNIDNAAPAPQSTFRVQSNTGNVGTVVQIAGPPSPPSAVPPTPTVHPPGVCNLP